MSGADFNNPLPLELIKAKAHKYVLGTYRPADVAFFFGQGEYLYDTNSKQYIDFLCGIAVTNLGHGEADIIEAIREQADRQLHTATLNYNQEQPLLCHIVGAAHLADTEKGHFVTGQFRLALGHHAYVFLNRK